MSHLSGQYIIIMEWTLLLMQQYCVSNTVCRVQVNKITKA